MPAPGGSRTAALVGLLALFGCSGEQSPIVNADIVSAGGDETYIAGNEGLGDGFVKRLANGRWTTVLETTAALGGVWTDGSGFVVAVGGDGIDGVAHVRADGVWTRMPIPGATRLSTVWGFAPNDVLAPGGEGMLRFDGTEWTGEALPVTAGFRGIWGSAPNDVFAVGTGGAIVHFDGSTWQPMQSGMTEDLNAVWGIDSARVFAVGGSELTGRHVVLRFDGTSWTVERSGGPFVLLGVHGTASGHVFAVGATRHADESATAALLRFDGRSWHLSEPDIGTFLWDVLSVGGSDCLVIGPNDTIARVR